MLECQRVATPERHEDDAGRPGFDVRGAAWRRMALATGGRPDPRLRRDPLRLVRSRPAPTPSSSRRARSSHPSAELRGQRLQPGHRATRWSQPQRRHQEPYTAGSAFDSSGNFYVTDDYTGEISEYAPDGTLDGVFASGLQNPFSLVFDNRATSTSVSRPRPTSPSSPRPASSVQNIGPLADRADRRRLDRPGPRRVHLLLHDRRAPTSCATTCAPTSSCPTSTSAVPVSTLDGPAGAGFELQILPDGDVLVADSNADILLDPNGNVLQTYTCASLPGCQGSLFAISLDPDGTSFWTGDSTSGDIWQVDIASGTVLQTDRHALARTSTASPSTTRSRSAHRPTCGPAPDR